MKDKPSRLLDLLNPWRVINRKLDQIMSAISDYTTRVDAHLDKLDKGIKGLGDDIKFLKDKIIELQNSPGPISPADQALLDALEARVKTAAEKAEALDAQTEQAPEPPPA